MWESAVQLRCPRTCMPPRKKAANHAPLGIEQFILLKKPLEHLGKQVEVPGSFWSGRMSAAERDTKYN